MEKLIKPYDGSGDIMSWLMKLDLVAKLTRKSDLQNIIPLFLEGVRWQST